MADSFSEFKGTKVFKGEGATLTLNLNRFSKQYTRAQTWLDSEVLKDSDPYVPMRTGTLVKSGIRGTVLGSGLIVYNAPYARYQYYGTAFNFNKTKHPQAQAYWFEGAKAANKSKWIRGVKKLGGGG